MVNTKSIIKKKAFDVTLANYAQNINIKNAEIISVIPFIDFGDTFSAIPNDFNYYCVLDNDNGTNIFWIERGEFTTLKSYRIVVTYLVSE